jgi:small acid-soluble spore protein (thioredoxin-like protein)
MTPSEEEISMNNNNKPKPDDRSDNAAEDSLQFTSSETQIQQIEEKNQRRRESIEAYRKEIKDET